MCADEEAEDETLALRARLPPPHAPPPPPARTIADVLTDIKFQQEFKSGTKSPVLKRAAQERIIELESELRWLECGEPMPVHPRKLDPNE